MNQNQINNQVNNAVPNPQNNQFIGNQVPNNQMINQVPNGMVNNQVPVNNMQNQPPVPNQQPSQVNTNQASPITLGTVSNVTYADTIGNINQQPNPTPSVNYTNNSQNNNQFIGNVNYNETMLNDLNVDGAYNNMQAKEPVDYMNDPQVQANLNKAPKKTVPISKELKTIFILVLILFAFTFIMPMLADLVNKIRFH